MILSFLFALTLGLVTLAILGQEAPPKKPAPIVIRKHDRR